MGICNVAITCRFLALHDLGSSKDVKQTFYLIKKQYTSEWMKPFNNRINKTV